MGILTSFGRSFQFTVLSTGITQMRSRILGALAGLASVLGLAAVGHAASTINFDPTGGGSTALQIDKIDWATGNSLAVGGNQAIRNFISGVGSTNFTLYYQAQLGDTSLNNTINTPSVLGAGGSERMTVVAGMTETVTSVNTVTGIATFTLAAVPTVNFVNLFINSGAPSTFSNDLLGTGFKNGTQVLTAFVTTNNSNFQVTSASAGKLDQFDAAGGPSPINQLTTVGGTGSSSIVASVDSYNTAYFPEPAFTTITLELFTGSQELPYNHVSPSEKFLATATGIGAGVVYGSEVTSGAGLGKTTNLNPLGLGFRNGDLSTAGSHHGGQSLQLQVEANSSFVTHTQVPEPASLAMWGLGLAGAGLVKARRRRRQSVA